MTNYRYSEPKARARSEARSIARDLTDEVGIRGVRVVQRGGSWTIKVTSARI